MTRRPVARRPPRQLQVVATRQQSALTRTIIASGPDLDDFPDDSHGAHLKLFLPREGQTQPVLPTLDPSGRVVWPALHERPIVRTYSVRHFDAARRELHIEFVLHAHAGPASSWAAQAAPGDHFGIAGPGGPLPMLPEAEYYVLAGDLSARPAIAALLEWMPASARGIALCEVPKADEHRELAHPVGVELLWHVNPGSTSPLPDMLASLELPRRGLYCWLAGEHRSVVSMRDHVLDRYALDRHSIYATPYWKRGEDEEAYHAERHDTMDELTERFTGPRVG